MTVRNLGDWSPLDEEQDPVYADPERVEEARGRYQKISTTIGDAVDKLKKIFEHDRGSLAGKYVNGLEDGARSVHDSLTKAKVRYDDVASEIKKYQPSLDDALKRTATALDDARDAKAAQDTASKMPDPQPGADGVVPPEEAKKDTEKKNAKRVADDDLTAAKNRLRGAVDDLNVAGKRFGDAVNCKKYDDGLTDQAPWRVTNILKFLSKVFSFIAIGLGILAMFFPGFAVIALGLVASVFALAVDSALYATGSGSALDVAMAALGLAAFGLAAFGFFRGLYNVAKAPNTGQASQTGIRLDFLGRNGRPIGTPGRQATGGPATVAIPTISIPKIGFLGALGLDFKNMVNFLMLLKNAPGRFFQNWAMLISGLTMAPGLAAALGISAGTFAYGVAVSIAVIGFVSIIYTGLRQDYPGRYNPVIPEVNPSGYDS